MARTVTISKSKALNFKRLTFLYLIFFIFFFQSSPGEFVVHFQPLSQTQTTLNSQLIERLQAIQPMQSQDLAIKTKSLETLSFLDSLEVHYLDFSKNKESKLSWQKEQKYAKQFISRDKIGNAVHEKLSNFILAFPEGYRPKLENDLGVTYEERIGFVKYPNRFLKEAPNGTIGAIIAHLKMVVLTQTLQYFKKEVFNAKLVNVSAASDSALLQGFKSTYYVGEEVVFDFFSRDSIEPIITINDERIKPTVQGRHFLVNWNPTMPGDFELKAAVDEEGITHMLSVVKPTLRFLETEQEIAAYLSEPLTLTLDLNGMDKIKNLTFISKGANIQRNGNILTITPDFEGRFEIDMMAGNILLDKKSVFALKGNPPRVAPKDIAGRETELKTAHCLESMNPNWQVLNFKMTVCYPNGKKIELNSNTRFLRNELRTLEKSAPKGSTILFHNIRLINKNGISTMMGTPIFINK
jgi:hypothetical protein